MFEIGTEELPAAYLPSLIDQLGREAAALLQANHLPSRRIQAFGTPRRLVLLVQGLADTQRKPAEEVRGPSKQAAYGGDGKPTQALLGFLKSQGGSFHQTKIVASDRGEYVFLVKPPVATPTVRVLPTLLPQLIGRLRAPKTMRWDGTGLRFARPIRWLLALYGAAPIRCTIGRLTSAPATRIGGPLRPKTVAAPSIDAYHSALTRAGVILDHQARRAAIQEMVNRTATSLGGRPAPEMLSYGLLDEVTSLVEQPVELVGSFDPAYLSLPREVLLASMAKHQRVFAIESSGRLLPKCLAILDGKPGKPGEVRKIVERILNARLADSLLFGKEDHARLPLERMAAGLSGITFHERLGSMAEKTLRMRAVAEPLAEAWNLAEDERQALRRACQLAKADLVSTMVKEFPTLQGVVGKYYALDSGESQAVALAIEEHYLPAGDRLPATRLGSALAILDKYETLTSYFGLGIMPTGDQDPFGLRRAAQGIVEIAWAVHRPVPFDLLFRARSGLEPFRTAPPKDVAGAAQRVKQYLLERLDTFAWPNPVPTQDCIEAVLASPCHDLIDVMDRIQSLQRLTGNPRLLQAAKVIERTRNILKGAPLRQQEVDPARLREPLEQQLWDRYCQSHEQVAQLAGQKSYEEATALFGERFFEPLHAFFDKVLVNVPDESLQQNRLALMRMIHALYTDRIADLSKLTILQQPHEEPSR
ncbi:MAG: glycine--tRNA ligase subunit beta [Candidatus Omnitrophica bacterium]|nr:glycine--tRNA ligase subunit beta [Candidatus Omnitrophota bacterium]